MLWDARRQLACIARHGLNVCQIRGTECVEGYRLGYYALQLRDTREMITARLRVRLKRPNLSTNWNVLTLPVCSLVFCDFNSQFCWRTGDHVLMPNVKMERERWLFHF